MKLTRFKTVFLVLAIAAAVVGVGSLLTSVVLTRNAVFAQLAIKQEAAELFGDGAKEVLIGNPQNFLALDPNAYLEGTGENGAKLINDTYLRENNIYPIQVKTVEFLRNLIGLICLVGGGLMLFLWRFASRPTQMLQKL
jgi:hypothetical protein